MESAASGAGGAPAAGPMATPPSDSDLSSTQASGPTPPALDLVADHGPGSATAAQASGSTGTPGLAPGVGSVGPMGYPQSGYPLPRPVHTVPLGGAIPAQLTTIAQVRVTREPAPPEVAHALLLGGPGTPITVRRRLLTDPAGHIPVELRTSYLPRIADDNRLAQPVAIAEPWITALAVYAGQVPATGTSHVHARRPAQWEAVALRLPHDAIVIVRATTLYGVNGAPIDHTVSIWSGDSTRISAEHHTLT